MADIYASSTIDDLPRRQSMIDKYRRFINNMADVSAFIKNFVPFPELAHRSPTARRRNERLHGDIFAVLPRAGQNRPAHRAATIAIVRLIDVFDELTLPFRELEVLALAVAARDPQRLDEPDHVLGALAPKRSPLRQTQNRSRGRRRAALR
jgi:hypothetical protein